MITLITGAPGTGKTAWLINEILELRKKEPNKLLFIHGIRNLRGIAHETIYCNSQLCDICRAQTIPDDAKFVENWVVWKQSDSLIIVDEVQRIWRPRTGGAQPSPAVSGLETHRHYGLDFWLISQGPHLFDNFIRLLVGRHVHLVARWSGRTQYEFPECKQDVTSRGDAVSRPYKLPLHVYKHYDSAEVHTKQDKRKPLSFYAVIGAACLAVVMVVFMGKRLDAKINPADKLPENLQTQKHEGGGSPPPSRVELTSNTKGDFSSSDKIIESFKPKIDSLPWTAPVFVDMAKAVSFPRINACVSTPDFCRCYSQQGTVVPVSFEVCQASIQTRSFNMFKSDSIVVADNKINHSISDSSANAQINSANNTTPPAASFLK